MKKVFIVHGLQGSPNGAWRPWLMSELEKQDVYACALPMPSPDAPIPREWVKEIARAVESNPKDQIYLVGHSLGVPAILRYLERTKARNIKGAVLAAGLISRLAKKKVDGFVERPFDFKRIKKTGKKFLIIHGDNDDRVPLQHGKDLAGFVQGKLIVVKNGGHLNGASGFTSLPVNCLKEIMKVIS